MAITQVEYKKKRTGTRYHPEKKCYVGYRIDVRINNVRYRNKRFATRDAAEKYIENLKLQNAYARNGLRYSEGFEIPRVSEVFRKRLEQIKNKSERVRAERVFKYFENLLEVDLRITEVRKFHFQKFINARLEDGVKPETVNREVNALSPPFKTAAEVYPETLEDYDPGKIPRPRVKRHKGRTRVVTEKEKNLICAALRKARKTKETDKEYENRLRIARMFEIAWLLGLRFGEVAKLKKDDFRLADRTLKVIRWKTGVLTLFEFLPAVVCEHLQSAVNASETEYIYTLSGNYPKNFYPILRDAVESCGLVYGRDKIDGITFHSNRHSFTTRLIQSTDLATAQSFTGHSTKELLGYYGHASDESRRAALAALYGEKRELTLADLREIFDRVQNREIAFAEFCELVTGTKIEAEGTNRTHFLKVVK